MLFTKLSDTFGAFWAWLIGILVTLSVLGTGCTAAQAHYAKQYAYEVGQAAEHSGQAAVHTGKSVVPLANFLVEGVKWTLELGGVVDWLPDPQDLPEYGPDLETDDS